MLEETLLQLEKKLVEKWCKEVFEKGVGEDCCREVLGKSVGEK